MRWAGTALYTLVMKVAEGVRRLTQSGGVGWSVSVKRVVKRRVVPPQVVTAGDSVDFVICTRTSFACADCTSVPLRGTTTTVAV